MKTLRAKVRELAKQSGSFSKSHGVEGVSSSDIDDLDYKATQLTDSDSDIPGKPAMERKAARKAFKQTQPPIRLKASSNKLVKAKKG